MKQSIALGCGILESQKFEFVDIRLAAGWPAGLPAGLLAGLLAGPHCLQQRQPAPTKRPIYFTFQKMQMKYNSARCVQHEHPTDLALTFERR